MVPQAWRERQGRCVRGQGGSQLPSGSQAARFAIISSHTQDLHHKSLALSSHPLLRFLPPLPGHFSLLYLLKSVGVPRAGGWGISTDGWRKRGVRAKGESCLSSMEKYSHGSVPLERGTPGQETTWHNGRGAITRQLLCAHTYIHIHTHKQR